MSLLVITLVGVSLRFRFIEIGERPRGSVGLGEGRLRLCDTQSIAVRHRRKPIEALITLAIPCGELTGFLITNSDELLDGRTREEGDELPPLSDDLDETTSASLAPGGDAPPRGRVHVPEIGLAAGLLRLRLEFGHAVHGATVNHDRVDRTVTTDQLARLGQHDRSAMTQTATLAGLDERDVVFDRPTNVTSVNVHE